MAPCTEKERQISTTVYSDVRSPPSECLRLCINNKWYDLTQWQRIHPGGQEILQHLNGQDATDAFFSLHSEEAVERLSRLKPCSDNNCQQLPPPTELTISFRQLRQHLIDAGYFKRSAVWELFYHVSVYMMCLLGTFAHFYRGYDVIAILVIGLGMQQAGWVGHDYAHGRGIYMRWLCRTLTGLINGFSPTWWSHKHNTHHVFTNHIGVDTDVSNDPVIHLFHPCQEKDVWFRTYQHFYFGPVASLLFVSWRWQSLVHSLYTHNYLELIFMLPSYLWLYSLGWPVALGSILLGGFLVAIIVTATHQSEEMIKGSQHSFVETQFLTTRDARCDSFLMEWLWGGMQYQLEHHLFPTIPKYNYARVRPLLRQWAQENGIEYRCDSVWSIWRRNYQTLKQFAASIPDTPETM